MSPLEASEVIYEEPNWREVFEEECARWPKLPRYLAEDSGFESTLKRWRRFHATGDQPAGAVEGMIALAALRIFPPRNLIQHTPRDGVCFEEQFDNHCWLIMSQRAWRIQTIEDRMMVLDSFGESTQIDMSRAKWDKYIEKAVEAMEAAYK